uniref:Serine threonine-protein kinase n=1 Tax=Tetraselmis sp. GSL018 TaxID=582737 RepID=A0A061SEX4_9CHLO|eukprot:CAMPEP_0177591372 /NCGR_PEP_ID=MMETSP0419_2-20121207/7962_1 /TAXON_ID=582737 /ORGANISM="Tetraselmis sp., Strain GSL018" /LENGTH=303 /DNA_ID=CAMNT_0019082109 /DNA_START=430 /DNA_END=1341 /DNA_ORIENTATION=-
MSASSQPLEDYVLQQQIGSGAHGDVYKAIDKSTNEIVAVKFLSQLDGLPADSPRVRQCEREIRIHSRLKHPNIVQFHKVVRAVDGTRAIVMEFVDGFTVTQFMEMSQVPFGETHALHIFRQLIRGVEYLHTAVEGKKEVVNRDIKLANTLLTRSFEVKLCDFGFAKESGVDSSTHSCVGTLLCMAPEMLKNSAYDGKKADIWSCGVMLYAMVAGRFPFWHPDDDSIGPHARRMRWMDRILCEPLVLPPILGISPVCWDLITRIMHPNPEARPSLKEIQQHPFLALYEDWIQGSTSAMHEPALV